MFGRFKKTIKESRTVLVIDIGSGSIRAAVAEIRSGNKIRVIRVYRYPLQMVSDLRMSKERIRAFIKRTLSSLIAEVTRIVGKPDRIEISLSAPFFMGKTGTVIARRDASLKVSYDEINSLLVRESENISRSFSGTFSDVYPIEPFIMESKVNGYVVSSPIGLYGEELSFSVRFSFISASFKKLLEEAFLRSWHAPNIRIRSSPVLLFSLFKLAYPARRHYIVFDIGAEVSQLILVSGGSIISTYILAQGMDSLARRVANQARITVDNAQALIKIMSDEWRGEEYQNTYAVFKKAVQDFQKELSNTLEKNLQSRAWPYVFMVGGGANSAIVVQDSKQSFGTFLKAPVSFYVLRPEAFKEYFVSPLGLRGSEDIELIALLLYE